MMPSPVDASTSENSSKATGSGSLPHGTPKTSAPKPTSRRRFEARDEGDAERLAQQDLAAPQRRREQTPQRPDLSLLEDAAGAAERDHHHEEDGESQRVLGVGRRLELVRARRARQHHARLDAHRRVGAPQAVRVDEDVLELLAPLQERQRRPGRPPRRPRPGWPHPRPPARRSAPTPRKGRGSRRPAPSRRPRSAHRSPAGSRRPPAPARRPPTCGPRPRSRASRRTSRARRWQRRSAPSRPCGPDRRRARRAHGRRPRSRTPLRTPT